MDPLRAVSHQSPRGSAGRPVTYSCCVVALVLSASAPSGAHGAALDPGPAIAEHAGGYVLELDAPSSRTRGKCLDVTLSNFGKLSDRKLWLVVRSMDRAGTGSVYDNVALVDAPASRVGPVAVCLSQVPEQVRAQGLAAAVIQLAVYRASPRDLAAGFWSGPEDDNMRLSNWLSIPDTVLRVRLTLADRPSKSRAP